GAGGDGGWLFGDGGAGGTGGNGGSGFNSLTSSVGGA
ncbi:PE-PGRS family protein, partial [Mycobacterium tuberculosis]